MGIVLPDRNLLIGEPMVGVRMHDVVRDFSRAQYTPEALAVASRRLVGIVLQHPQEGGWSATGPEPLNRCVHGNRAASLAPRQRLITSG